MQAISRIPQNSRPLFEKNSRSSPVLENSIRVECKQVPVFAVKRKAAATSSGICERSGRFSYPLPSTLLAGG